MKTLATLALLAAITLAFFVCLPAGIEELEQRIERRIK